MKPEIKAVKAASPDPQTGKPKPKSGVSVPYYDITQSIAVAKTVHFDAGGSCTREQLATLLKYSGTNNGGFLTRVSAAKAFGLIELVGDEVRITARAQKILTPVMPSDAERAKVEAFLGVEFFETFYQRFKSQSLPLEAGLKNLLGTTYNVVPGRVVAALRVLMDSADQAGFFKVAGNRSKMVMPLINGSADSNGGNADSDEQSAADVEAAEKLKKKKRVNDDGDGAGTGETEIPAALLGLLQTLPKVGSVIHPKRRQALTDAFKNTIDYLYPVPEEDEPT